MSKTLSDALVESVLLRAQMADAEEAVDQLLVANAYMPESAALKRALLHRSGREDVVYTKQYFTIGRQAHVRSTQSIGAPSLVWHVAFWPKRGKDPQDLDGKPKRIGTRDASAGRTLIRDAARETYDELRRDLAEDLDKLLIRLQERGRVPGSRIECFGEPKAPKDWEAHSKRPQTPVKAFATESIVFTLWWGDPIEGRERSRCPKEPPIEDLRVRVQADIHADFATVTFIIDASKPWNSQALDIRADAVPGMRRARVFEAARNIRKHAASRLEADPVGAGELLPESGVSTAEAKQLLDTSRLLYRDIWEEFCDAFDCRLIDIAGETDKVFANFRGVVLSAPGKEGEKKSHLSRFVYGSRNGRGSLDEAYPNAVIKAHWPFIRRTRSEADYRDWIACGVFDWRALYITALGGQSDFDPGDEASVKEADGAERIVLAVHRADTRLTTEVPSGYLPQRTLEGGEGIVTVQSRLNDQQQNAGSPELKEQIKRLKQTLKLVDEDGNDLDTASWDVPETAQHDRPAPFHYLFLATDELDRRQIGRMVDRVNLLGTVRLYAMKNYSVIRDADVHLRIYGQLLDQVMSKATEEANNVLREWWGKAYGQAKEGLAALWRQEHDLKGLKQEAHLRAAYAQCVTLLSAEEGKLAADDVPTERPLALYRRLLDDIADATPQNAQHEATNIFRLARDSLAEARTAKSRHDEDMAQLNRQTDLRLQRIKTHIDELGRDAIGGLPFRINRAHFYAEMYRTMVDTLRVGSIDTWWDYKQLASRGVDPPLKFIENVGERLDKIRTRLRDAMDAVQTSAIANQTEATRDNTFQLEVIADETGRVVEATARLAAVTEAYRAEAERLRVENEKQKRSILRIEKYASRFKLAYAGLAVLGFGWFWVVVFWLWDGGFGTIVSWVRRWFFG
jgi:hypothetical protein